MIVYTNLWFCGLAFDCGNGVGVARQCVDTGLGSHVPDTHCGIAPTCSQNVDGRMDVKGIDGTQVTMIVPDDLLGRPMGEILQFSRYLTNYALNKACLQKCDAQTFNLLNTFH